MAILSFFAILLLIAFPLNEVGRISPMLHVSFTLLDVVVGIGAGAWLLWQLLQRKFPHTMQAKAFGLTVIIFVLSLLVNIRTLTTSQFMEAALYIVRWLCYGTLFFMVFHSSISLKKNIERFLFGGGVLLLLFGYLQFFMYPELRNLYYAGWDVDYYRMFATFFDPNFFGLFLVLFFLFVVAKCTKIQFKQEQVKFILYILLEAATFFAILLSYSRTALISLVIGVVILFWQKRLKKYILPFFVGTALFVVIVFTLGTAKLNVNSLFRTTSSYARITSAQHAITIFSQNPLLGVGFNAYRYAQYRLHFMPGSALREDHGASGTDVSMLFVLATSGIIGFVVFLYFLYSHFYAVLHAKNRLGLATITAWIVGSLFINGLFYPSLLVWVWVLLGITTSE